MGWVIPATMAVILAIMVAIPATTVAVLVIGVVVPVTTAAVLVIGAAVPVIGAAVPVMVARLQPRADLPHPKIRVPSNPKQNNRVLFDAKSKGNHSVPPLFFKG